MRIEYRNPKKLEMKINELKKDGYFLVGGVESYRNKGVQYFIAILKKPLQ